jgi:hypothetical protein
VFGREIDIRHDNAIVLYGKPASFIHPAKGAFVVGTASGYL